MEKELAKRKSTRLKGFDYDTEGAYFVTICVRDRKRILSDIKVSSAATCKNDDLTVGDGAFDVPQVQLKPIGKIIEKYLLSSQNIPGVTIDEYVIMPDHIHAIIFLDPEKYSNRKNGTSREPSPTNEMLPHVISTFKRLCNKEIGCSIFQRSYADHIIRDKDDYQTRRRYIYENPMRWYRREIFDETK